MEKILNKILMFFNGDVVDAIRWLKEPKPALEGLSPLEWEEKNDTVEVLKLINSLVQGVYS